MKSLRICPAWLLAISLAVWPMGNVRAAESSLPRLVLVAESGQSRADDAAISIVQSPEAKAKGGQAAIEVLDLGVSRNRAVAARYHVLETPLLLSLSAKGMIISRDEKHVTMNLVLKRIEEAKRAGPELDAKLWTLQAAAEKGSVTAQLELTDFLLAHQNDLEAIPVLEEIAHEPANDAAVRLRAWVELGKAHLWIAEVEKARHEADDLITTLGATVPEARAGGNLIHGLLDARGKRVALARKEFEEAVASAPKSVYGREASEALKKLPKK